MMDAPAQPPSIPHPFPADSLRTASDGTASAFRGGILPALRAGTGELHQQLEDAVGIERRLADQALYRRLLEIFLGFYRPLESRLICPAVLSPTGREKTLWLKADLHALGLSAQQIDRLPDCHDLPAVDTPARTMGCLYVLEGATLGGRHISGMMAGSVVPATARRFFAGYGSATGERWREFVAALEQFAAGAGDAGGGEIVQGARETFACLHRWYVRQCPINEFCG